MESDERNSTTISPERSPTSEIDVLRQEVQEYVAKMRAMEESLEQQQRRTSWLVQREATKINHITGLAAAVESDRASRDRQTEAVLLATRKLSDLSDDLEWVKGGVQSIVQGLNTQQVVTRAVSAVVEQEAGRTAVQTAVQTVREITTKHPLLSKEDLEGESSGKVGAAARIIAKIVDAPPRSQLVLIVLLVLLVLSGWVTLFLHRTLEAPAPAPAAHETAPRD